MWSIGVRAQLIDVPKRDARGLNLVRRFRTIVAAAALAAVISAGPEPRLARAAEPDASAPLARVSLPIDRVRIAAGYGIIGSNKGALDEQPRRRIRLKAFYIDRTEVTRGMYRVCARAGACPSIASDPVQAEFVQDSLSVADDGSAAEAALDANLPITGVSHSDAQAFCAFAGGQLPSAAQWERAARGRAGRAFPWGDDLSCEKANWGNYVGEGPCADSAPGRPVPVGRYPQGATPEGVLDMGGNVWEWVADVYPEAPERRIVKGGSCCSYFVEPRAANVNAWAPEYRDSDLGFRCVSRKRSKR